MPIPYDFKSASRNMPQRRASKLKLLRFIGLLVIVAVVTIGVVMIIVPDKEETENVNKDDNSTNENTPDKSGQEGNTAGNSGDDSVTSSSGSDSSGKSRDGEKNGKKNRDADEKNDHRSVKPKDEQDNSGKNTDNEKDSGKKDDPVNNAGSKGKVQSDDLPANEDKPVFRTNQAPGAAEALSQAAGSSDPDEIMAVLCGFLMKEYSAGGEYSGNWNAAGKELAAALRKKAEKNDWKAQRVIHKVVSRDNFIKIARRYHTTVEGIKLINKRKSNNIRIGEKLSVVPGPWRITISKKARLLNVWRKEKDSWQVFAVFPIGVGRKNLTPNGNFVIINRLRHPRWYGPDGRIFAYGDKENPLGDYFLKLKAANKKERRKGYGIHGSADDSSMGRSVSNGCIRMKNSDVEILYYLLPAMTPVEITD